MKNIHISKRISLYFILAGVFFLTSFITIYFIHRYLAEGSVLLDSRLLSWNVMGSIISLLALYYLADGLRLHFVIRAMGYRVPFGYIMKLVFVNIFVSNVTPLATGGGVAQVYLLSRKNVPVGDATAATSIRTILAVLILFSLTPIIIFLEPNLFNLFYSRKVIFYIPVFTLLYLGFFFMILFRTRTIAFLIFQMMRFLQRAGFISRRRFRKVFLRVSRETRRFSGGFRLFLTGRPLYVFLSFLFTCIFLLLLFSFSVVLVRGLGYSVSAPTILAFQVVVTFFMYFAPTPGAAGVAEGGYGLLFAQVVGRHDITLLTISWRFLTIYLGVLVGILIAYMDIFRSGTEIRDGQ